MRCARLLAAVIGIGLCAGAGARIAHAAELPNGAIVIRNIVEGDQQDSKIVMVETLGDLPRPSTSDQVVATLVDSNGRHAASVRYRPPSDCVADEKVSTGMGTSTWCLQLSGLDAGTTVKGTVTGSESTLTLTITNRATAAWPILLTIGGIALGVLVAWLATSLLPTLTTSALLKIAIRSGGSKVAGLREWSHNTEDALSEADRLARVRWMVTYGKGVETRARARLRELLEALPTEIPTNCPLIVAAAATANATTTTIQATDLVDEAGDRKTPAAEAMRAVVQRAVDMVTRFDGAVAWATPLVPKDKQELLQRLVASKNQALTQLAPLSVDLVEQVLDGLLKSLETLVEAPPGTEDRIVASLVVGGRTISPSTVTAAVERTVQRVGRAAAVVVPVMVVAALVVAVAAITVLYANYYSNDSFGSTGDYWKILLAAAASSSTATVLAALVLIKGPDAWYGS